MLCLKCGKEIEKDGQFCKFCGTKIEKMDVGETEEKQDNLAEVSETPVDKAKKQFKKTSRNRIIIIGSILIAVLLIVILLVQNNPVNKYLALIQEGQTAEATELYNLKIKGDEDKETEIYETCVDEIKKIEAVYLSGKADYKETLAKLSIYSGVHNSEKEYEEIEKNIFIIQNSRIAYSEAVEYEKINDIPNAMIQYSKVIEKDSNFTSALNKITELTGAYKNVILTEVENLSQQSKFAEAIAKIDNAFKIINSDAELVELKKSLIAKREEVNAAKKAADEALKVANEAAEKERLRLYADKQIIKGGLEITFKTAKLATKIVPDSTSGAYIYYNAESDEIFLDLIFKVKNISSYSVNIYDIISNVNAIYNNNYKYNTFSCFYSTAGDISPVYDWDSIDPLKTVTYHLTVSLPRVAADSSNPISITFNIFGEKQFLQFR